MPVLLNFIIGFIAGFFVGITSVFVYLYFKLDFNKIKEEVFIELDKKGITRVEKGSIIEPLSQEQEEKLKNPEWEEFLEKAPE